MWQTIPKHRMPDMHLRDYSGPHSNKGNAVEASNTAAVGQYVTSQKRSPSREETATVMTTCWISELNSGGGNKTDASTLPLYHFSERVDAMTSNTARAVS